MNRQTGLWGTTIAVVASMWLCAVPALAAPKGRAPTAGASPVTLGGSLEFEYGMIEIGGSCVKASVVRIVPIEEGRAKDLDLEIVQEYATENVTGAYEASIGDVVHSVARLASNIRDRYQLDWTHIQVVGSSGVARAPHHGALKAAVDAALANLGGPEMSFISAAREAQLEFDGVVNCVRLAPGRVQAVLIDIGSRNTKGAYATTDYPAGKCGSELLATFEIAPGTKARASKSSFKTAIDSAVHTDLDPEMQGALGEGEAGLQSKPGVYLSGGVVWALATFTAPENRQRYFALKPADIDAFVKQLRDNARCITDPGRIGMRDAGSAFLDLDLSAVADPAVRGEATKDVLAILVGVAGPDGPAKPIFTDDELLAGAEILEALKTTLNWDHKTVYLVRPARRAWMLGNFVQQENFDMRNFMHKFGKNLD